MAMSVSGSSYGHICIPSTNPTGREESVAFPIHISSGCKPLQLTRTEMFIKDHKVAIVQPNDVDEVLDMYISQGRLEKDPYWCRIWPSAIALAEEIVTDPELVQDLKVCDLGSGLGLSALAAALSGAKEVVLLDQEPLALVCALSGFHENILGIKTNLPSILQQFPDSRILLKSQTNHSLLQVTGEIFDWTKPLLTSSTFDIVLACDLLYEKTSASYLAKVAPRLLRTGGLFLLVDPVERTPKHRELFLELLQYTQLEVVHRSTRQAEMDGKFHQVEFIFLKLM